ncbi:MAG: ArnT family glycosyltransferase [Planctomycetaceae bacterium]
MPWLLVILAVAFVVRAAGAVGVQAWVSRTPGRLCLISGDAEGYWELAQKLTRGADYAIHDPPRYVLRMPGFPLLIAAGMALFGESPLALRLLLAGVGTLACALVFALGVELFDRRTALLAAALAAISPTFIVCSVMFLSETLFAAAMLGSLWLMARLVKLSAAVDGEPSTATVGGADGRRSLRPWWTLVVAFATGIGVGMATLVRPTWLLAGPGFAALYALGFGFRRTALVAAGLVLMGLGLTLAPWTIRNYYTTGHLVVTTLWSGPSLYDGLNPNATGASEMQFIEKDGVYQRLSEYDADRHYRDAAIEFARNHPRRVVELALVKLGRYWSPSPNSDPIGSSILVWGVMLWSAPFLLASLLGAWQARGRFWNWFLPAAPVLYFSLLHLLFVGSARYRLPAEYPLCVLAAVGLVCVIRFWDVPAAPRTA